MKLSDRIMAITGDGSDGWELFVKARRMKQAGIPVVELTIGQHEFKTDQSILDAMHRAASAGNTGYALMPGIDELRDNVARRAQRQTGTPTTRDNVLIVPGGQAGLFAAHVAALDAGETGLYVDPYYATYPGTIRAAGGRDVAVTARPENGFQPCRKDLAQAADNARSLLINSPNNPTGVVYDQATINGICDVARDCDLWLISDEVYDGQVWDGSHLSPRSLPSMAERTIVVNSMSKTFAMTGSRVGWVIAPEAAIERMIDLSTSTTYGVAGFIQEAACFALGRGDDFERALAAPYRRRRDIAAAMIASQNRVQMAPAAGTMYVMLDIGQTGLDGEAFAHRLLDERNIAVMPGSSFGHSAVNHIRVAMTVEDKAFEAAFATLLEFAEEVTND